MARNNKKTQYRLITPTHMDVVVSHFKDEDEAVTEAKKRGVFHRTMLYVKNLDGEWQFLYDSQTDLEVENKRLDRMEVDCNNPSPFEDGLLTKIMGRHPIEFYKRRRTGGMCLTKYYISENEDPLPFIRSILLSDDFICWTLPIFSSPETRAINRFYPFGNDASYLFKSIPKQLELFQ